MPLYLPIQKKATGLNEIKFYKNPSAYQWTVDRNSDVETDGSGTTGSLRYCVANSADGDTIIFADTLTDTAGTGKSDTVIITSTITSSNVLHIYGNKKIITTPFGYNRLIFDLGNYTEIFSLYFFNILNHKTVLFHSSVLHINFYGCKFKKITSITNLAYTIDLNTYLYNCEISDIQNTNYYALGGVYSAGVTYIKCNIFNIEKGSSLFGNGITLDSCYIEFTGELLHNNDTSIVKNCTLRCLGTAVLGYTAKGYWYNNIIFGGGYVLFSTVIANNGDSLNFIHNTVIDLQGKSYMFRSNVASGITLTYNIKNNLFLTSNYTYLIESTAPTGTLIVNSSGNIYSVLNVDPKIANSAYLESFGGTITDVLEFTDIVQNIDGVNRNYLIPKGIAVGSLNSYEGIDTDFNGKQRTLPTDVGAVQVTVNN